MQRRRGEAAAATDRIGWERERQRRGRSGMEETE
jgi:hypothetical protein